MKILNEVKRSELVAKSRNSEKEKDGKTRYQKRVKSRILSNVKNLNQIDMNQLFKENILTVNIDVLGETDNYVVTISFGGFLDKLHTEVNRNGSFDLRATIRALVNSFNSDNVYIHCSCPDWRYRLAYYASKNDINSGELEIRPSDITNPGDTKGPGCKHVMLVLANHSWLIKVASVVVNYINYMKKHYEKLYADIIYPAIYEKEYTEEPVQLGIEDTDELNTDQDTLDKSNAEARAKGQFKTGNEYRYPSRWNRNNDENQASMFDDEQEQ